MNPASVIVLLAVLEALGYAVWKTFFSKKKTGLGGCSGNCESCGKCLTKYQQKKTKQASEDESEKSK